MQKLGIKMSFDYIIEMKNLNFFTEMVKLWRIKI